MFYIALKELPQGQQPGEYFEATEAAGDVLVMVGAARKAEEDEAPAPPAEQKRRYLRRDLRANA